MEVMVDCSGGSEKQTKKKEREGVCNACRESSVTATWTTKLKGKLVSSLVQKLTIIALIVVSE
ncbi:unnamed protein product [Sphenostylis stenocarpa]|uniref:Uncharacterized protein n=1 Tax=Sphenostylis stenocarpa TaxID=92480 RepID=A0AA86T0L9_9FABA|nr:unnamed protein product [Sphenostylis stenocarpa]